MPSVTIVEYEGSEEQVLRERSESWPLASASKELSIPIRVRDVTSNRSGTEPFQHSRGQSPLNKKSIAVERSTFTFSSSDVRTIYFNLAISASVSGTLLYILSQSTSLSSGCGVAVCIVLTPCHCAVTPLL